MAVIDLARLAVGAAFLAYAAASDLRTRTVSDRLWIALGAIAVLLAVTDLWARNVDPAVGLALIPATVLLFDPLLGPEFRTEDGRWRFRAAPVAGYVTAYAIAIGATVYGWVDLQGEPALPAYLQYLTVPAMMLVYRGMYEAHLLKGGADAKGMIVLAALVPAYPDLAPLPLLGLDPRLQGALSLWFPFSLVVLADGVLLSLVVEVGLLVRNASRGDLRFPHALLGYKVPLDRVPKFVWFMDVIRDGKPATVFSPRKRQDRVAIVRDLKAAGFTEAWVTPGLPLLVFIWLGYLAAFLVGNVLMWLLALVIPHA